MPLNGHRILLVEDEFLTSFYVESIIREARGEVVAHGANLAQAMRLADSPNLSLAILDLCLGSETSLPVAAKLHVAGVPFIFHTGSDVSVLSKAWPHVPIVAKPLVSQAVVYGGRGLWA